MRVISIIRFCATLMESKMALKIIPIVNMTKKAAQTICGSLTQTSKMPCKSNSLPTEACQTGFKMAQIEGSICSMCYADKGFYAMYQNTIKPAQFARLDAIHQATESSEAAKAWISGMVSLIGNDKYFRWHDSGDLQSVHHLSLIVLVAMATPNCEHWLPTREYGMVKQWVEAFGSMGFPKNLIVRLSAMYPDQPVKIPASLSGVANIAASNVHSAGKKWHGTKCNAPENNGECGECRMCWTQNTVSYELH